METEKRPWLRADVAIRNYFIITDWQGSRSVFVPLKFSLKNYGEQPAINVRVYPEVLPHPGNTKRDELVIPQKRECDGAASESDKNPIGGIAIFPSETSFIDTGIGTMPAYLHGDNPVLFVLLGCVDYTYGNGRHGQTGFRFLIGKVDEKGSVVGIPFQEGTPEAPYDVPDDLKAKGYPATGPKMARIPVGDLYFKPDDSGNYAK